MKFQNIFLDFDGTLMNTSEGVWNGFYAVMDFYGMEHPGLDVMSTVIGPPLGESFKRVLGVGPDRFEEALKVYRDYYTPKGLYECHLYDGIIDLLKAIKDSGRKLFVATSKPEPYAVELLKQHGIYEYFDYVCGSDMAEKTAGKANIIRDAFRRGGLDPEKDGILMVGDTKFDIAGAKETGIKSAGILWGFGSEESIREAGADYIYKSVQDVICALEKEL